MRGMDSASFCTHLVYQPRFNSGRATQPRSSLTSCARVEVNLNVNRYLPTLNSPMRHVKSWCSQFIWHAYNKI